MAKDFQKSKVYMWEHSKFSLVSKKEISYEECVALVNDICRCYGLNNPIVVYPDYEGKRAYYSPLNKSLVFPKWSRHRHFIIHELAHYIDDIKGNGNCHHGETFFSIYAYLISEYNGYPLYEIFHKSSLMGIKHTKDFPKFVTGNKPMPELIKAYS